MTDFIPLAEVVALYTPQPGDWKISFGVRYPKEKHPRYAKANGRGYVVIEAGDSDEARRAALVLFGADWSRIYPPGDVMFPKWWPLGELDRFNATDVLAVRS